MKKRAKVVYLPLAVTDLEAIADYLCLRNPEQAVIFRDRIDTEISRLARFPHLGVVPKDHRLVRDGYRVLVVLNYLIFYVVRGPTVEIHRVLHGARDYASLIEEAE